MEGQYAGVCIKNFLTKESVLEILDAIDKFGIEYYTGSDKAGKDVKKGKLGPNFFRYKDTPAEYFALAAEYKEIFEKIILKRDNPVNRLMTDVQYALRRHVRIAKEGENTFSQCTIRDLSEAPPHTDWLASETIGLQMPSSLLDQFAWNVYLQPANSGGDTIIYQTEKVVPIEELQTNPAATYRPTVGDLLLFRSRNVHSVMPGCGKRITLSGFFGPSSNEDVLFWV